MDDASRSLKRPGSKHLKQPGATESRCLCTYPPLSHPSHHTWLTSLSHLLGKKSWNVYNTANIARVRRDEAEAKAKEEAEEQRMQEGDAKRRLAILRGEAPHPVEEPALDARDAERSRQAEARPHKERKARKLPGEDVTDFELRVAKDQMSKDTTLQVSKSSSSAPLIGRDGHIDLLGDEKARHHSEKNKEVERETAKRNRECEGQFSMRLSNAAGRDGVKDPWYTAGELTTKFDPPAKDVWGNEDPRRREREVGRLAANDPLSMMKSGAARAREVNKARRAAQQEREEELRRLKKEERRRERKEEERRHRHRRHGEEHEGNRDRRWHRGERRDSDRRRRSASPPRAHRRSEERRRH